MRVQIWPMLGVVGFVVACGEDPSPADVDPPDTATDTNDTGEVITPTTGDPEFHGCLRYPESPYTGIQHQCGGFGYISVRFTLDNTPPWNGSYGQGDFVSFGAGVEGDSYEKPMVMACCTEAFDDELPMQEQPHYESCFHDFVENGCRTAWAQLSQKAADTKAGQGKSKIQNLANWLATHQQECYEEFFFASDANVFVPEDEFDFFSLEHVWELPASAETIYIKEIEIEIGEVLPGYIDSVTLPENPTDWLSCESQKDNNDAIPVVADVSEGDLFTLAYGDLSLLGPGSPPFEGLAELTSIDTECTSGCSVLSADPTEVGVWVHGLILDTAAPAGVTDGTTSAMVDRARITLYAPRHAAHLGGVDYIIPTGEAMFVVSAVVDGAAAMTTAVNTSDILIEDYIPMLLDPAYGWIVHPFELTYTDGNEDLWTLETGTMYFYP